jgi:tRNA-specific 2-thiouridylase
LGIAHPEPLYVLKIDAGRNQVVVGTRTSAKEDRCIVNRVNWVSIAPPLSPIKAEVQIRYRTPPEPATIVPLDADRVHLYFDEPQFSITPGQAAVWYDGDRLLGGGIITGEGL